MNTLSYVRERKGEWLSLSFPYPRKFTDLDRQRKEDERFCKKLLDFIAESAISSHTPSEGE